MPAKDPFFDAESIEASKRGLVAVKVSQLAPGMRVADFRKPWWSHMFLGNSASLSDWDDVAKIRKFGSDFVVFIDPPPESSAHHASAPPASATPSQAARSSAQILADRRQSPLARARLERSAPPRPEPPSRNPADHRAKALTLAKSSAELVSRILSGAADGKPFSANEVADCAARIAEAAKACPDAFSSVPAGILSPASLRPAQTASILASAAFARGLSSDQAADAAAGALLLDLGNAAVPAAILQKPSALSPDEARIAKAHVQNGILLLEKSKASETALTIVAQHHERFVGTGYPNGLHGNSIDPLAQIGAVVDAFCALTQPRPWRGPLSPASAVRAIHAASGTDFSPAAVAALVRSVGVFPVGTLVLLSNQTLAAVVEQTAELLLPKVFVFRDARVNLPIQPNTLDLSRSRDARDSIRILSAESWARWSVDPRKILPLQ